jgi:hypothetical protein
MENKSTMKLEIGTRYLVNLVIVNTPSNFFVQLVADVPKTGNMMNNLDNYYRNGLLDKDLNNEWEEFSIIFQKKTTKKSISKSIKIKKVKLI